MNPGSKERSSRTNKDNRDQGDRSEKSLAFALGMKPRRGSGSGPIEREDLIDAIYLAQAKSTRRNSVSITKIALDKLVAHSFTEDREPVMVIEFVGEKGPVVRRWVLEPMNTWRMKRWALKRVRFSPSGKR